MCKCDCCGNKHKEIDPARARWIQKRRKLRKQDRDPFKPLPRFDGNWRMFHGWSMVNNHLMNADRDADFCRSVSDPFAKELSRSIHLKAISMARDCAKESFTGKALDIVMRAIDKHDMNITGERMS